MCAICVCLGSRLRLASCRTRSASSAWRTSPVACRVSLLVLRHWSVLMRHRSALRTGRTTRSARPLHDGTLTHALLLNSCSVAHWSAHLLVLSPGQVRHSHTCHG